MLNINPWVKYSRGLSFFVFMNNDETANKFKPKRIKYLLIGESPPKIIQTISIMYVKDTLIEKYPSIVIIVYKQLYSIITLMKDRITLKNTKDF
jgi:hypothetical protein